MALLVYLIAAIAHLLTYGFQAVCAQIKFSTDSTVSGVPALKASKITEQFTDKTHAAFQQRMRRSVSISWRVNSDRSMLGSLARGRWWSVAKICMTVYVFSLIDNQPLHD